MLVFSKCAAGTRPWDGHCWLMYELELCFPLMSHGDLSQTFRLNPPWLYPLCMAPANQIHYVVHRARFSRLTPVKSVDDITQRMRMYLCFVRFMPCPSRYLLFADGCGWVQYVGLQTRALSCLGNLVGMAGPTDFDGDFIGSTSLCCIHFRSVYSAVHSATRFIASPLRVERRDRGAQRAGLL